MAEFCCEDRLKGKKNLINWRANMISRFIMKEKFLITGSRAAHDEEGSTGKSMIFFSIRNVRGARCSTANKIFKRVKS